MMMMIEVTPILMVSGVFYSVTVAHAVSVKKNKKKRNTYDNYMDTTCMIIQNNDTYQHVIVCPS